MSKGLAVSSKDHLEPSLERRAAGVAPGKRSRTERFAEVPRTALERARGATGAAEMRLGSLRRRELPALERAVAAGDAERADVVRSDIRTGCVVVRRELSDAETASAGLSDAEMERVRGEIVELHGKVDSLEHEADALGPAQAIDDADAHAAMQAAADIVQHRRDDLIAAAPAALRAGLRRLFEAQRAIRSSEGTPEQLLGALDRALAELMPARRALVLADPDWVSSQFDAHVSQLRQSVRVVAARRRVDAAVLVADGTAIEVPETIRDEAGARQAARALAPTITKLVATMSRVHEQAVRIGHDRLHHVLEHMPDSDKGLLRASRPVAGIQRLVTTQAYLLGLKGMLEMPEALHHLHSVSGFLPVAENAVHFVAAACEALAGASR